LDHWTKLERVVPEQRHDDRHTDAVAGAEGVAVGL
jgi:hypothetical protein